MQTKPTNQMQRPVIVPVDDETRAMLDYANSPEGRAKIEKARQEIKDGKYGEMNAAFFKELDRDVTARVARRRAKKQ